MSVQDTHIALPRICLVYNLAQAVKWFSSPDVKCFSFCDALGLGKINVCSGTWMALDRSPVFFWISSTASSLGGEQNPHLAPAWLQRRCWGGTWPDRAPQPLLGTAVAAAQAARDGQHVQQHSALGPTGLLEPCAVTGEQRPPSASWALRPPHAHRASGSNARKKTLCPQRFMWGSKSFVHLNGAQHMLV